MSQGRGDGAVLERLFAVIRSRQGGDPERSYTARLMAQGTPGIARKVGEEAVETVVEALAGDRGRVVAESADLLYHLLVLWAQLGIEPAEVWAALEAREGTSGLEEKRFRTEK